jgi:hypothetical protein
MSVPLFVSERSKPALSVRPLSVGCFIFEQMDQIDLTGPFEVLSRMPETAVQIFGKELSPVRDVQGLRLTPDVTVAEVGTFDVLLVPGGHGQQALMHDEEVLALIHKQVDGKALVFRLHRSSALRCGRCSQRETCDDALVCTAPDVLLRRGSRECKGRGGRQHHQRCRSDGRAGCGPRAGLSSKRRRGRS